MGDKFYNAGDEVRDEEVGSELINCAGCLEGFYPEEGGVLLRDHEEWSKGDFACFACMAVDIENIYGAKVTIKPIK